MKLGIPVPFRRHVSIALILITVYVTGQIVFGLLEDRASTPHLFRFQLPLCESIRNKTGLPARPKITNVHLSGSFNGWNPANPRYRMVQDVPDRWQYRLPLDPGRYEYKFSLAIEGIREPVMVPDPGSGERIPDDRGWENSVVSITDVRSFSVFFTHLLIILLGFQVLIIVIRFLHPRILRFRERHPVLFQVWSLRRRLLFRLAVLAVLSAVFFPLNQKFMKADTGRRLASFRFSFPVPEGIRKKYQIPPSFPVKKVVLAGSFNSWNPHDPKTVMRPDGNGGWSISLPLNLGEHAYKFVLFPEDTANLPRWANSMVWTPDSTNPVKVSDGFDGSNSVLRIKSYRKERQYLTVFYVALVAGLVLLTLLEGILRYLMHIRLSLGSKLVIVFIVLILFSNIIFITITRRQGIDALKRSKINEISMLHVHLLAAGADFGKLGDPVMNKKMQAVLDRFFTVSERRFDFRVFSNRQMEIAGVYLYNPNGELQLFSENSVRLRDDINIYGSRKRFFEMVARRGREFYKQFVSRLKGVMDPFFFSDWEYPSRVVRVSGGVGLLARIFGGYNFESIYYPVFSGGKFRGYYIVGVIPDAASGMLWEDLYFILSILVIVVFFMLVLIKKLGHIILRPLNKLVKGMNRVRGGDLEYRVDVRSSDELENLGNAYNYMTSELAGSRKTNEDYSRNLENKVETRTRELRDANERLQELDRLKTRFFANISHELRTPLTLLLAPLESLRTGELGELPERVSGFHDTMYANSLRLLRLINNLLDYSRLESGAASASFRKMDVRAALSFLAGTLQSAAESKDLRLELDAPKEAVYLYLNRQMFEKVVMNLLSNAFKFTPSGGKITIRLSREAGKVRMAVEDTGIGIPKEKQDAVFERFSQVDGSEKREYEGTGIGLSLVRELVAVQRGTIVLESEPGMGSVFTIEFPEGSGHLDPGTVQEGEDVLDSVQAYHLVEFAPGEASSMETAGEVLPHDGAAAAKVLVVDDNADMRRFITFLLEGRYAVTQAADGEEGLEKIRLIRPDLVISDVMMPRLSGYELCTEVKRDPVLRHTPVILLTARADTEQKIEGLEYGADDYLAKPFNSRELLVRVENLLKNRLLQRELSREKEERDLDFGQAAAVQRSILTPAARYRSFPGLEIAVSFQPMNGAVSGDYYHLEAIRDEAVTLLIADATGHGVQAALTTMQIDVLNNESLRYKYPDERLEFINRRFVGDLASKNFFTCFLADFSPGKVRYSSAAHPAQYLLRAEEREVVPLQTRGRLMGLLDDSRYELAEEALASGDVLVFFSDGLTEEFDPEREEYGEERLKEFLQEELTSGIEELSMEDLTSRILAEVESFRRGVPVNDDITLVVVRIL